MSLGLPGLIGEQQSDGTLFQLLLPSTAVLLLLLVVVQGYLPVRCPGTTVPFRNSSLAWLAGRKKAINHPGLYCVPCETIACCSSALLCSTVGTAPGDRRIGGERPKGNCLSSVSIHCQATKSETTEHREREGGGGGF